MNHLKPAENFPVLFRFNATGRNKRWIFLFCRLVHDRIPTDEASKYSYE